MDLSLYVFSSPTQNGKGCKRKKGVDLQKAMVIVFSEQVASVRNPPIGALGIDQEPRLSNPSRIIYDLLFSSGGTSNILTEGHSSPKQLVLEVGREIIGKSLNYWNLLCRRYERTCHNTPFLQETRDMMENTCYYYVGSWNMESKPLVTAPGDWTNGSMYHMQIIRYIYIYNAQSR